MKYPRKYRNKSKVKIDNINHAQHNKIGEIIDFDEVDNTYWMIVDNKYWCWVYSDDLIPEYDDFTLTLPPNVSFNISHCFHEWREDSFFTARVYKTCKHCGAKHEELEQETSNTKINIWETPF